MANGEPARLVNALKHCTHCGLDGMHTFQFFNNKRESQPRYECLGCHQQFTQGGGSYHKTKRKKFRSRHPPPPRASTPPSPRPLDQDEIGSRIPADEEATPQDAAAAAGGGQSEQAGESPSAVTQVAASEIRVTTSPRASTPPRPRRPSEADLDRARERMARCAAARQAQCEAGGGRGGGESSSSSVPPGVQVVTGVRVTTGPSGVAPGPPRQQLVQVTTKFGGESIVRCILMDPSTRISDGY